VTSTPLGGLALSRSTVDRAAHRRADPGLTEVLLADPATAVLLLAGDQLLVDGSGDLPTAVLLAPAQAMHAEGAADALRLFLGEDAEGRAYLALALPAEAEPPAGGARWAGLREVGSLLDDRGAGLFTTALALGRWHATHPHCARCGAVTNVIQAGWARSCPVCGAEHYPRTDPAVIMAVVDADGRLLLGHQRAWPPKRYSTLAGFVEPGESLEAAVRREVAEESGVVVGEVEYLGSQPWPFPSSLMLGFRATAMSTPAQADGVELADVRWWTREQFEVDVAAGEILLPPRVSIARRLIEDWYGGPVAVSP
jgi:NAD+ diphosphatase